MSSVYVTCCTPKSKPLVTADMFRHSELNFIDNTDHLYIFDAGHHGRLTVLDRQTGFTGCPRDTESGFRGFQPFVYNRWHAGNFWLASQGVDVRIHADGKTSWDALVTYVKQKSGDNCL